LITTSSALSIAFSSYKSVTRRIDPFDRAWGCPALATRHRLWLGATAAARCQRRIDFKAGHHDFTIEQGGLNIFPRLVVAERHEDFGGEMAPSGSQDMDTLWGDGFDPAGDR